MKTFLIERDVPGAGSLSHADLVEIAQTSNRAVASMDTPYVWITTYVTGDKLYCVHQAVSAEAVREHARRGGFPVTSVAEIVAQFDARTASEVAA